jgi:cell division protein FtsZ
MPQVKPEVESFARIKVIGVGGSGGNAVNHMVNQKVKGVDFIAVNTDAQDLHNSLAKKRIHIGKNLTKGLGTGMSPDLGRKAIEETKEEVQEAIKGSDMVFISCGLGGGTGSGASPVVAQIARESGALTVAVVTKPFFFEGQHRGRIANEALQALRNEVDAIIVIPNDRLLNNISKETTARNAFAMCDDVLKQAVEGMSDLITTPGLINVDFADVKAVLKDAGSALMGIGIASGEKRAEEAARIAINSPLLDVSINGARGVLFSIAGNDDLTMFEIQDAAKVITESMDPDAKVIFGTIKDEKLNKGEVKVTIIASGFPDDQNNRIMQAQQSPSQSSPSFMRSRPSEPQEEVRQEKSKIFNVLSQKEKEPETPIQVQVQQPPVMEQKEIRQQHVIEEKPKGGNKPLPPQEDEDEWSAVPAFLRRSKLK